MLVLFETPAGYAFFKLLDEKKLKSSENLFKDFETAEKANRILKLKHFEKFQDTTEALAAATALVEGKMSKALKKSLKKLVAKEVHDQILVADAKLGGVIKEKMNLNCMSTSAVQELMRCIRSQIDGLLAGLPQKEMTAMALGLAHSLSRYKLKFSPDKVDTMIVQAISLLDDLDKELNNYVMRCREWYGWHFPELGKIVTDNTQFVNIVKKVGTREKMTESDLSDIVTENIEEQVKEAAEISMGTEISEEDIDNIQMLCDQVIEITTYRGQLFEYLQSRMMAIAPNLSILVGELIGARLISHAGSLLNLAKHPASTVQILGAEKALFRALKTHKDTPKYGIIYHAHLVGQASTRNKGKLSRMLAAKASLAIRYDALGEETSMELGTDHKSALTLRLKELEEGAQRRISGTGKAKLKSEKYSFKSEIKQYPTHMDSTIESMKRTGDESGETSFKKKKLQLKEEADSDDEGEPPAADTSISKKKKKKKRKQSESADEQPSQVAEEQDNPPKKKKKKHSLIEEIEVKHEEDDGEGTETPSKKKKKKKKHSMVADDTTEDVTVEEPEHVEGSAKKKKKKKKSMSEDA